MLTLLALFFGLFDLAELVLAAIKYWRASCSLLIAATLVVLMCFFVSSPSIRLIAGYHMAIVGAIAGVFWEKRSGHIRSDAPSRSRTGWRVKYSA
jgi:hypothetical protein